MDDFHSLLIINLSEYLECKCYHTWSVKIFKFSKVILMTVTNHCKSFCYFNLVHVKKKSKIYCMYLRDLKKCEEVYNANPRSVRVKVTNIIK